MAIPLVLTLARTGVRIGEALALTWDDIDFKRREILIRRTYSRDRFSDPKTYGSYRVVDMSLHLAETLKALSRKGKKEAFKKGAKPPELVFCKPTGGPLDQNSFRKHVWVKALKKAGLPHYRIHDLRHTYATLMITNGADLLYVSNQLGHASLRMTLDTYTHWLPTGDKSQVDSLDKIGSNGTKLAQREK